MGALGDPVSCGGDLTVWGAGQIFCLGLGLREKERCDVGGLALVESLVDGVVHEALDFVGFFSR